MHTVVEGVEQDIDSWMELVRNVRWNFPGLESENSFEEHKNTVLKFMKQNGAICVKDGKKIISVLLFSKKYNMICCLAVSTNYRNQGIGSALPAYALNKLDRTQVIILDTAKRELYEETGAIDFEINPVCIYSVIAPDNFDGAETFGKLFFVNALDFLVKAISKFVAQINEQVDENVYQKLSYTTITQWLKLNGFLVEEFNNELNKNVTMPTEKGINIGIRAERRSSMRGVDYMLVIYGKQAQEYIVHNMEAILSGEVAE